MKKLMAFLIIFLVISAIGAGTHSRKMPNINELSKKNKYQQKRSTQSRTDRIIEQRQKEARELAILEDSPHELAGAIIELRTRVDGLNLRINLLQKQNKTLVRQVLWLKKTIKEAGLKASNEPDINDTNDANDVNNANI